MPPAAHPWAARGSEVMLHGDPITFVQLTSFEPRFDYLVVNMFTNNLNFKRGGWVLLTEILPH